MNAGTERTTPRRLGPRSGLSGASIVKAGQSLAGGVRRLIDRFDPNDDPDADPVSVVSLAALAAALAVSVGMFVRWRFQPMQDLGHHLALSAVVADRGRPGSLYTDLYEPIDPLAANSLLYLVAGYSGRLIGVTTAVRAAVVFYLAGLPLATLYALRVFGRSAWGAVLSVPLAYNMCFVAGFANMLFAAPMVVLAVPLFYLALHEPTYRRLVPVAVLFLLVFLSHAHAFLWLGALAFGMTLAMLAEALAGDAPFVERVRSAWTLAVAALACVLPSLLLFARWYRRAFGAERAAGGVTAATSTLSEGFGASFHSIRDLVEALPMYALKIFVTDEDLAACALLGILFAIAIAAARMHRYNKPPVLEFCCAVTFASYFFLPERLSHHDVLGSRQPSIALWFLPAFLSPVPAHVSRVARAAVVIGIVALTVGWLEAWHDNLLRFEHLEVAGLAEVLDAAPPRKRMHYVKMVPESDYFTWNALWHVDKFYMADKFGTVPDTPGILSTSAIRYRSGIEMHRITDHADDWPENAEIWAYFDLVLVHDWTPEPEDLELAQRRGRLLAEKGAWQLWQVLPESHVEGEPP